MEKILLSNPINFRGDYRRISARLRELGIVTVKALRDVSPKWLRSHFGVVMERTGNELRGMSCLALEDVMPPKKQIVSSRSFGQLVLTLEELNEAVSTYMARSAEKLRRQQSMCGAVHVFVRTNPFRLQDKQYSNGIVIPLPDPSNDSRLLTKAALFGLKKNYRPGYWYKKVGVMLMELSPAANIQGSLFDPHGTETARSGKLMAIMDTLNRTYGRDTVVVGSAGIHKRWPMLSENRTPQYTTRWDEVPLALAR